MGRSQSHSPALSVGRGSLRLGRLFQASGCLGVLFAVFFCGAFLLAGTVFLFVATVRPLWKISQARSWIQTPCNIVNSEVAGDGDTFRVAITYTYQVSGRQYTGDQYSFSTASTGGRAGKQAIVDSYPPGSEKMCYVNPFNPQEAVLHRGFISDIWWGLASLPFLAVGLGGFWVVSRSRRSATSTPAHLSHEHDSGEFVPEEGDKPRFASTHVSAARIRAWTDSDFDDEDLDIPEGPITLDPESSPVGQFVGCLIVSIILHVFIVLFFSSRWDDWQTGEWDFFPDIFAIPAALGSLLCIAGVIHAFLGMFNPRPILTLSRPAVPLGGRVTLQWSFDRNPSSIRSLTFELEGIEEARYRRGTSTYTDTETFYKETLSLHHDPIEIAEGQLEITIPTDTIHSFSASNNKIKWRLTLKGEIPMWPDVTANFPLRILPHEPHA